MNLKNVKINFLGDSITKGTGTSDPSKRFTNLIEKNEAAICRNYGVGGTRIARQTVPSENTSHDEDYVLRAEKMEQDADVIFVFGGTNDFGHGDAPLGEWNDRTPYTFYGALHCLCTYLLKRYPKAQIVFATPLHRLNENNLRGDGTKKADAAVLHQYVSVIREIAEYYAFPLLDLYETSGLQPNVTAIRTTYVPDGVHPNDAGHLILAEKITAFLKAL